MSARKPDPLLGQTLADKYELVEQLGIGGCGIVYRAIQHPVGREVAVKTLRPGFFDDQATARFFREAEAIGHLHHAATVKLFDYGEDQGHVFMAMELVRGETLKARMRRGGAIPPERAVDIARQVLEALAEAHAIGLVHRDLKPSNIMLTTTPFGREQVRLLDFGIAKSMHEDPEDALTQTGYAVGTIAYMAPEQAGGEVGATADLYSMGVVLFQMLSGTLPFKGASTAETLAAALRDPAPPLPDRPGITAGLRAAVNTALAKRPAARFRSAAEMAQALARSLEQDDQELTTAEEMVGETTRRLGAASDKRLWAVLVVVVALTAAATVWWRSAEQLPIEPSEPSAIVAPQVLAPTVIVVDAAVPDAAADTGQPEQAAPKPATPRPATPKPSRPKRLRKVVRPKKKPKPAEKPSTLRRY